jgi:hypothetical protein
VLWIARTGSPWRDLPYPVRRSHLVFIEAIGDPRLTSKRCEERKFHASVQA